MHDPMDCILRPPAPMILGLIAVEWLIINHKSELVQAVSWRQTHDQQTHYLYLDQKII